MQRKRHFPLSEKRSQPTHSKGHSDKAWWIPLIFFFFFPTVVKGGKI